jgi:hypothetical protein
MSTQSPGTSNPSPIKWLETKVQQALARAGAAVAGVLALQNRAFASDGLDDLTAPSEVIVAAIECTDRGSGLWLCVVDWFGTLSGAGTVTIDIAQEQGPVTAFSGGTLEQPGGGTQKLPSLRYALTGAVTATATGGAVINGSQARTLAGGAATALTASAVLGLSGAEPANLILIRATCGVNLSGQTLNTLAFELP